MKHLFGIAATGLLWSSAALGQTTAPPPPAPTSLAPPTPPAPLTPPPDGTLAVVRTSRLDANGNQVVQQQSTYRDTAGVAQDQRTVQTTTVPPPPATTTTTTSSATSTDTPH